MKVRAILLTISCLLITTPGVASEIRGNFWVYSGGQIPAGTLISVYCGAFQQRTVIQPNGSYSIRGLPPFRGCHYQIKYPDGSVSSLIAFNSGSGVVQINGKLRKYKNRILVISR